MVSFFFDNPNTADLDPSHSRCRVVDRASSTALRGPHASRTQDRSKNAVSRLTYDSIYFWFTFSTSSPPPFARTRRLEREHREVRGQPQVHLPDRLIPGLGAKGMMPQNLDVAEVAL